jgi:hypothetical protein
MLFVTEIGLMNMVSSESSALNPINVDFLCSDDTYTHSLPRKVQRLTPIALILCDER